MIISSKLLLDQMKLVIQARKLSYKTGEAYLGWVYRFLLFNNFENPKVYNESHIGDFLSFLEYEKKVSTSTRNQALNALSLFYRDVLRITINVLHTKQIERHIVVLSLREINSILAKLDYEQRLMVSLFYGSGLRLSECLYLRVGDLDFENWEIIVFENIRNEFHRTLLPKCLKEPLLRQITKVDIRLEENNIKEGFAGATVNYKDKCNHSINTLKYQYLFPSERLISESNKLWQHHRDVSYIQKAVKLAVDRSKISKNISCNSFRHSFAFHLLENGCELNTVQHLLGHKNINSTRIYSQLLKQNNKNINSPLDEKESFWNFI
jgi:integrase